MGGDVSARRSGVVVRRRNHDALRGRRRRHGEDGEPKYDDHEAVEILSNFLEERDPALKARAAAGHDLLAAFEQAAKRAGFDAQFRREDGTLHMSHLWGGHTFLFVTDSAQIGIASNDRGINKREIMTLRFDRAEGMFTSTQLEEHRSPEPGQPKQYRSALAELAQAAQDLMKSRE